MSALFSASIIVAAALAANPAGAEQGSGETNAAVPTIVMDGVPLLDALKNLARLSGINYIIAPDITSALQPGPGEGAGQSAPVNVRWENLTAQKALAKLMAERQLALVENPESSIARISRSNERRKPTGVGSITSNTNVIPLMVMDDVPLNDALKNLARMADLDLSLDPKLADPRSGISRQMISIRWEGVTAAQGLAALLDNYDLVLTGITNSTAQITARSPVGAGMDRPGPGN